MADGRRGPGLASLVGVAILLASLGGTAWWFTRPAPPAAPPGPALDELDVVCTGRVDAEGLVVALDPPTPGRVVRVDVKEGDAVIAGQPILAVDDTQYRIAVREAQAAVRAAQVELDLATTREKQFPKQVEVK